MRRITASLAVFAVAGLAACGGSEDDGSSTTAKADASLAGVKTYLLEHTAALESEADVIRTEAEAYHRLAGTFDFDHAQMLRAERREVAGLVRRIQAGFRKANPAYEEMEGVVAGVPILADFDVIIDAGGDASDPENAVPFDLETPAGRTFRQPGNLNYLIETAAYGTELKFAAKGVEPDLDGDGRVEFGEAVPDADFLVAAARKMHEQAAELDAAAREWKPMRADAFTALVVMTPTMSEYFQAWKSSRFIAGAKAQEKAFVAASRLEDIADILSGLVVVYDTVEPSIAKVDRQQARQTATQLADLTKFVTRLRDAEAGGRQFTAGDADTLGTEAQRRAEAIAGQVSQAAGRLSIDLET